MGLLAQLNLHFLCRTHVKIGRNKLAKTQLTKIKQIFLNADESAAIQP